MVVPQEDSGLLLVLTPQGSVPLLGWWFNFHCWLWEGAESCGFGVKGSSWPRWVPWAGGVGAACSVSQEGGWTHPPPPGGCPERLRVPRRSLLCLLLPPVTCAGLSQASQGGAAGCLLSWDRCRSSWPWGCPLGAGCDAQAQLADLAVPYTLSIGTELPGPIPSGWALWVSVPQALQGPC